MNGLAAGSPLEDYRSSESIHGLYEIDQATRAFVAAENVRDNTDWAVAEPNLKTLVARVRRLVHDLRPPALDDRGLVVRRRDESDDRVDTGGVPARGRLGRQEVHPRGHVALVRRAEPVATHEVAAPSAAALPREEEPRAWVEQVDEPKTDASGGSDEAEWREWVEDDHRETVPPPVLAPEPVETAAMQPGQLGEDAVAPIAPGAPASEPAARAPVSPRLVRPGAQSPAAFASVAEDESIAGLLARLERGAAQRRIVAAPIAAPPQVSATVAEPQPAPSPIGDATPAEPPAPVSLDDTLQRLRRLAAG